MSAEMDSNTAAADVAKLNVNSGQTLPEINKNKASGEKGEETGEIVLSSNANLSDQV